LSRATRLYLGSHQPVENIRQRRKQARSIHESYGTDMIVLIIQIYSAGTITHRIKTVSEPQVLQSLGMLIERRVDAPNY